MAFLRPQWSLFGYPLSLSLPRQDDSLEFRGETTQQPEFCRFFCHAAQKNERNERKVKEKERIVCQVTVELLTK